MSRLDYYRFVARYLGLVAFRNKTLGGVAEHAAAERKDAPFLLFEGETVGFDAFNRLANRRANLFASHGIGKGDVVALLMENRPEYLTTLVGLAKLGAVTAAINYNLRGQALVNSLNTAAARKVIVGAECLEAYREVLPKLDPNLAGETYVDTRWESDHRPPDRSHDLNRLLAGASEANPALAKMNSKELFMYIYTSGTTGLPKAARINHYRWYAAGLAMGFYALRVRPGDTVYCPLPLYHSNGSLIAFGSALVNGARLALTRRFAASRFWEECVRFDATCAIYIGEVLRYLVNSPPGPHDRAHQVTRVLGNGLRPDIWQTFQERFGVRHIREFYASTEGNAVTINLDDAPGSVGTIVLKASDNLRIVRYDVERDDYIRDAQGFCQLCAPGEAGELLGQIKATTPFYGYSNPEESEKKILRNVLRQGDAFFRTGDLLKKDERGHYYFIDRIGDTFRWKGENVSTHEVAEILTGYPGLAFANVYGVPIPGTEGRTGMATLTMRNEQGFDPQAFHRFAVQHLPPYAVPTFLRLLPEVEVTGTFKLLKTELKRVGYNPKLVSDPLYFRDAGADTYKPLTQEVFDRIHGGQMRF
jgi:acyl-CoA synthetase (AMP-forming)/AMP-acid ligase II